MDKQTALEKLKKILKKTGKNFCTKLSEKKQKKVQKVLITNFDDTIINLSDCGVIE